MSNPAESATPDTRTKIGRFIGRQFLIKNRLQIRFAGLVILFLFLIAMVQLISGNLIIVNMARQGILKDEIVISQMETLNSNVFIISLGLMLASFLISIVVSNMVAGPIYRFEKILEQMKGGDLSMKVRIRKNDELQDTATIFNSALEGLREKIREERASGKPLIKLD